MDWFAGTVAEHYDEDTVHLPVEPVVDVLVDLARGGAALEFAIGTGRIALPLARRGLPVSGVRCGPFSLRVRARRGCDCTAGPSPDIDGTSADQRPRELRADLGERARRQGTQEARPALGREP